jgi:hypothetical protein
MAIAAEQAAAEGLDGVAERVAVGHAQPVPFAEVLDADRDVRRHRSQRSEGGDRRSEVSQSGGSGTDWGS